MRNKNALFVVIDPMSFGAINDASVPPERYTLEGDGQVRPRPKKGSRARLEKIFDHEIAAATTGTPGPPESVGKLQFLSRLQVYLDL